MLAQNASSRPGIAGVDIGAGALGVGIGPPSIMGAGAACLSGIIGIIIGAGICPVRSAKFLLFFPTA
jgi:hypothetical protein